jgi:type IV pilus assembly protein PilW
MSQKKEKQTTLCLTLNQAGWTLVELMVALAMAGIVMAVICSAYISQVRGAISQATMLDMQQTARAALEIMKNEIRTAGCDPTRKAGASILRATAAEFSFTMDLENNSGLPKPDGDTDDANESVRYALNRDANRDGQADRIPCDLGRDTGGGLQPFAENIDALNFVYLDEDGNPLAAGFSLDQIQAVQITLVARSGEQLRGLLWAYQDKTTYFNQQGQVILPAQADNLRRLLLTTTVYCRNL